MLTKDEGGSSHLQDGNAQQKILEISNLEVLLKEREPAKDDVTQNLGQKLPVYYVDSKTKHHVLLSSPLASAPKCPRDLQAHTHGLPVMIWNTRIKNARICADLHVFTLVVATRRVPFSLTLL